MVFMLDWGRSRVSPTAEPQRALGGLAGGAAELAATGNNNDKAVLNGP